MAEIPYIFELPPPKYFRENGWFKNPNMRVFITWAFSRCSLEKRVVYYLQKAVELEPFEFIFGRGACSEETGLTERQIRTCIDQLSENLSDQQNDQQKCQILKKTTSKTTNKYTVYKWSTELFSKIATSRTTSRRPAERPAERPQSRSENKIHRSKENHHPDPSSFSTPPEKFAAPDDFFLITDDSDGTDSLGTRKEDLIFYHNIHSQTTLSGKGPFEIYPGVLISKKDLEECIKIKGSFENVKTAVEYIMRSTGRKKKIYNWPNAMRTWKIEDCFKTRLTEHREMANRLINLYKNRSGYICDTHTDRKKDQEGILFYSNNPVCESEEFFVPFSDPEFKQKCSKIIRRKKMETARIPR